MAHSLTKAASAIVTLGLLAACGGGGGTQAPVTTAAPSTTVVAGGLNDTSIATAQAVTLFDLGGTTSAQFTPSDAQASVGGATIDVESSEVNLGLGSVVVLNGDEFAYIPATGTAPTSSATYVGRGLLVVTDTDTSTVFEGISNARLDLVFGGSAGGAIDFTGFDGTVREGLNPESDTSGQRIRITGVTTDSSGISGGSAVASNTFTDNSFAGASFDIDGAFAGVNYDEVGGVLVITATDGSTVKAGFGAAR